MQKDRTIIKVFLGIIFVGFLSVVINNTLKEFKIIEKNNDNWKVYVLKKENNILDKIENKLGSIENSLENRVTNNVFMYDELNKVYQSVNFYTNKIIFDNVPIKTNSDGEYVFFNKVNEFYYLENKYTSEQLKKGLEKQVRFFNELAKDMDVNVYIPTRYELTLLSKSGMNKYVNEFTNKLNNNVNYRVMKINDIDEYKRYFYKTDHHWNINGALNGYYSIMEMLNVDALKNLKIVENKEKKYYGSLAKTALNDSINDYISDVDVHLNYDVLVNGKLPDEIYKPRKLRLDRDYKYYDYYVSYFNGQYGNIVYDFHQENKDNLLIMSDSYAWQIDYLIAASFNKTHVINLRYDEYKNNKFDIRKYVKDNNIDKVLFLYEGGSIIFDQYNYNFEGRLN